MGHDHELRMRLKSGVGLGRRQKCKGSRTEDRVVGGDRHRDELGGRNGVKMGFRMGMGECWGGV